MIRRGGQRPPEAGGAGRDRDRLDGGGGGADRPARAATSTRSLPPPSLAWLGLLGVTSQSAGYLLISLSLPRLPAVLTSIILLAQPVATVGLSMLLLGEAPSASQLAGVALVVGGIAVATLWRAPHPAPSG